VGRRAQGVRGAGQTWSWIERVCIHRRRKGMGSWCMAGALGKPFSFVYLHLAPMCTFRITRHNSKLIPSRTVIHRAPSIFTQHSPIHTAAGMNIGWWRYFGGKVEP